MSNPLNLLGRVNSEFSRPVADFFQRTPYDIRHLAQNAPAACQGGIISSPDLLEKCIQAICKERGSAQPQNLWRDRPPFFDTIRENTALLGTLDSTGQTALRYHLAMARAEAHCPKDPPNDGNHAIVTDALAAPSAQKPSLIVALVGLAAIAGARLASTVNPGLRPVGQSIIQGIYLWMGMQPDVESPFELKTDSSI